MGRIPVPGEIAQYPSQAWRSTWHCLLVATLFFVVGGILAGNNPQAAWAPWP